MLGFSRIGLPGGARSGDVVVLRVVLVGFVSNRGQVGVKVVGPGRIVAGPGSEIGGVVQRVRCSCPYTSLTPSAVRMQPSLDPTKPGHHERHPGCSQSTT